jgi:hypothetical protein
MGFCIRQVNCTAGIKGFSPLEILHDMGCCTPYSVGDSVSGQDIDNGQKDDTENNLDEFGHFKFSRFYSDSMRSIGEGHEITMAYEHLQERVLHTRLLS